MGKCLNITISWCEKHENWWVTNCPDCMVDANEEDIKKEGRREVVRWLTVNSSFHLAEDINRSDFGDLLHTFKDKSLKAKLKDWGIDDDRKVS